MHEKLTKVDSWSRVTFYARTWGEIHRVLDAYRNAEVEMRSRSLPKSHYKSTVKPQDEECGGNVTSSDVAIEENAAYQSVEV